MIIIVVIFLDIDGVLNSDVFDKKPVVFDDYLDRKASRLDPNALGLLCDYVKRKGCVVVISSTWRLDSSLDEIKEIFSKAGYCDIPIVGVTDRIYKVHGGPIVHINGYHLDSGLHERGIEIESYRRDNDLMCDYIVIDDDDFDIHEDQPLVKVDSRVGLQESDLP